jgi:hypothetical protein
MRSAFVQRNPRADTFYVHRTLRLREAGLFGAAFQPLSTVPAGSCAETDYDCEVALRQVSENHRHIGIAFEAVRQALKQQVNVAKALSISSRAKAATIPVRLRPRPSI